MKRKFKIGILFLLFQIIYIPALTILLVFYGPFTNTRDMVVTTAMTTMTHQYFATWFLSEEKINEILRANRPEETNELQEVDEIKVSENVNDGIELVDVSSSTYKGYLLIINDPSRVKLASSPRLGKVGATTSQIIEANDAVGGINAGGFEDDALGTGGKPAGIVIEDGKLKSGSKTQNYKIVGLDSSNRMVISNSLNYAGMQKLNLTSAVTFGPVIIMNGQPTIRNGDGGWGIQPRTAIGQKKDGTVLMLVIDGRQKDSLGATLKKCSRHIFKIWCI